MTKKKILIAPFQSCHHRGGAVSLLLSETSYVDKAEAGWGLNSLNVLHRLKLIETQKFSSAAGLMNLIVS